MNNIEKLLTDTADFFENQLATNHELVSDLRAVMSEGQDPSIVRPIYSLGPGSGVLIRVSRTEAPIDPASEA